MAEINFDLDYYKILGIDKENFDIKDIKVNYKQLSKIYHPDINNGDDKIFKYVLEAYNVLSSESNRKEYDRLSEYGVSYSVKNSVISEYGFSDRNKTDSNISRKMKDFNKKDMVHVVINLIEFKPTITYNRRVVCNTCGGNGGKSLASLNLFSKKSKRPLFDEDDELECDICYGTGNHRGDTCANCKGTGMLGMGLSKCDKCSGDGVFTKRKQVTIREDMFDSDGKIILKYYGNYSKIDHRVGDLYIILKK